MTTSAAAMPQPRLFSVRARLMVSVTVLFSVIFAAVFVAVYSFVSQRATDRLAEDLSVLLDGTAKQIDGAEFRSVYQEDQPNAQGFTDDPRFWEIVDWLATIKSVDSRTGLYTMFRDSSDGKIKFVASASARTAPDAEATPHFLQVLDIDPVPDDFAALFTGQRHQWLLLEPYKDDFGYWISGYETIFDSTGAAVGVLGIDYRAEYLLDVRQQILNASIPAFAALYLIFFGAIYILSGRLTRPIKALTTAAEHIGEGDYGYPLPESKGRFQDEIGILSNVFRSMAAKLDQRETELRKQVIELKIEIDQAKASAQVAEIVDTDFFAGLQQKARDIRGRKSGTPLPDTSAQTTPTTESTTEKNE